jgi:capsular exopolysaccharide synthesis family protein
MSIFKKTKKFSMPDDGYLFTRLSKGLSFRVVEAYKTVRTNLQYTLSTSPDKFAIFTSYEPNAGKSITSANVAIALAQASNKVLLIDGDMRNASQNKIFKVPNTTGLSKLLSGFAKITDDGMIYKEVAPGLDLITAGPIPPNPSELLSSKAMGQLLDALRDNYDYILVDCPPVGLVTDALALLTHIKNIATIARQRQTTYSDLKKMLEMITSLDGRIIGAVLTDVHDKEKVYGHSYYARKNYYSYGYEK